MMINWPTSSRASTSTEYKNACVKSTEQRILKNWEKENEQQQQKMVGCLDKSRSLLSTNHSQHKNMHIGHWRYLRCWMWVAGTKGMALHSTHCMPFIPGNAAHKITFMYFHQAPSYRTMPIPCGPSFGVHSQRWAMRTVCIIADSETECDGWSHAVSFMDENCERSKLFVTCGLKTESSLVLEDRRTQFGNYPKSWKLSVYKCFCHKVELRLMNDFYSELREKEWLTFLANQRLNANAAINLLFQRMTRAH